MKKITTLFAGIVFCLCVGSTNVSASTFTLTPKPKTIHVKLGQNKEICGDAKLDGHSIDFIWGGELLTTTWERSNKNISLTYDNEKDDDDSPSLSNFVYGERIGKSKVYLHTLCNVYKNNDDDNITSEELYEGSCSFNVVVSGYNSIKTSGVALYSYDTRNNVFDIEITNLSNKTIRIYSKGARSYDCDYTKFDRKLKLTGKRKYVDIKPGKHKYVHFKVKGRTTWWNVEDEEIHFNVKWGKKKYTLCADYEGIYKWSKKRWISINKDDI